MHFLLVLLLAQLAFSSSIQLTIKDSSGAPLNSTGRLTRLATGSAESFTATTGKKTFDNLPPGTYRIQVLAPGFQSQSLDIDLADNTNIERDFTLAIGPSRFAIDVVSTTPLPGVGRSLNEIPTPIQTSPLDTVTTLNLPDFLNRNTNGVYLNEMQGNPFQMDLNYRGYTASPLLGTPQGISIYMDGVRLNQPFGDAINWDLIPRNAISEITLIPGSNPLFGLNTLGGALSIETKDGLSHPGTAIQLSGGGFGRKMADLEHGGSNAKGLSWFLSSSLFFEDGWRESSPSNVRQFLGKLGFRGLNLTLAFANNSLVGNGLQEFRLLERKYNSIYTKPDLTNNRSPFLNLNYRRSLTPRWSLSTNTYYRNIDTSTLNGDINEESLDQSLYQLSAADIRALTTAGFTGFPTTGANAANTPFPFWRCIAQVLQRDEPSEKCNGLLNRSTSAQYNYGLAGQLTWRNNIHQFTLGAAYDGNRVRFGQSTQLGYLNPDRSVTGLNAFGDGITGGEADGEPFDTRVDLRSSIHTGSFFLTDTLKLGSRWHLTVSGRFNRTQVTNRDRIRPGGGRGSLDGDHSFSRFNPSVGATARLRGNLNFYASYTEGSRAPTAIELGCADPESPCRLPNSMAGDPPLLQVVTRTVEAGLRGGSESNWRWNAGYFFADNRDDILFVASEQTGFGYFKNFGKTRRQGFEAAINGRLRRLSLGTNYTFLQATFQSPEEVNGTGNSTNEEAQDGLPGAEGAIEIEPGNRIPLTPRHTAKAFADLQLTRKFSVNLNAVAISSTFARGNENNLHKADGRYYVGPGQAPGYVVTNLGARYQLLPRLQLFLQANNLLNRRYYSAAQLGPTGFTPAGNFVARPFPAIQGEFPVQQSTFFAPGAPRAAWAGLRFTF
jgi:outer membrane receptor protein involved in Fe transport